MTPKYWLVLSGLAACAAHTVACSSDYDSCVETRTCASAAGESEAGAAGAVARGGGSGSVPSGEAGAADASSGESGASGEGGEGGEGGALATVGQGGVGSAGTSGRGGAEASGAGGAGALAYAGGGTGGMSNAPVEKVAPSILSITPVNGATKLTPETSRIVVTFSEPMDKASAQAAYVPSVVGASPAFSWNAAGNELTIDPKLAYPQAIDPTASAVPFRFDLTTAAKDLAGNSLLAGVSNWGFTLLREITQSLPYWSKFGGNATSEKYSGSFISAGDNKSDAAVRGFVSYDIASLPDGIQALRSATIDTTVSGFYGDPFGSFGNLLIQSVHFAQVDGASFSAPLLRDLGIYIDAADKKLVGSVVSKDVSVALIDDYLHRAARGNLSQYRVAFASSPNTNGVSDQVILTSTASVNRLNVKYLYP